MRERIPCKPDCPVDLDVCGETHLYTDQFPCQMKQAEIYEWLAALNEVFGWQEQLQTIWRAHDERTGTEGNDGNCPKP